jgi:hypothetical protein
MSLHQTLQGNEPKAKSPARHREAYRSRLVRPGCEVMEDRILLSTALPDHHLTASALIGSAKVKAPPKLKAAARWFSVDPVSPTQIEVSWARVAGATGYRVEELIGRKWVKIANLGSGSTSFVVPDLKPDTTYSFDVGYSRGATTTWAKYQNAKTSNNWSGYVAATNLSQPQPNSVIDSVTEVSGSWIVPTVTGPSTGSTYSAVWVGIDGWGNSTVEQDGTSENVIDGKPVYYAWWEMYSSGMQQPSQRIFSMTVEPGDTITASVQYITSGAYAGQFYLSIVDNSRPNDSFSIYASSSQYQSPLAQRSSAEWIVEAPTVSGSIAQVADFSPVTFTNASAVINGVTGPINDSNWLFEPINMGYTINGGSTQVLQATTSPLGDSGTSFVVTYIPSAA